MKYIAVATAMAIAVLAVAVASVVAVESPGPRSYLASWKGPGCTSGPWPASMNSVGACGCNGIFFSGGYEFNFRGETATLYTGFGCTGDPYRVFEDTRACGDFGWRSIHIDC
ncbi:hypothetical protein HU200_063213 [Digitaria exilis]|uniref:Antimicrobial peptide 1 n=1 Tax=Digitaria exilis TaxID=1010633 RepID=A0A835A456_9POAL|nr:hypothetical protein HU200_063213 [Digitaria exilis]